jgi:hypothetical protein
VCPRDPQIILSFFLPVLGGEGGDFLIHVYILARGGGGLRGKRKGKRKKGEEKKKKKKKEGARRGEG